MLDRNLAEPPHFRRVQTVRIFDANRSEPDLGRGVALGHVHMRRLDPVPGIEGESEAFDPKERRHAALLPSLGVPRGPVPLAIVLFCRGYVGALNPPPFRCSTNPDPITHYNPAA